MVNVGGDFVVEFSKVLSNHVVEFVHNDDEGRLTCQKGQQPFWLFFTTTGAVNSTLLTTIVERGMRGKPTLLTFLKKSCLQQLAYA